MLKVLQVVGTMNRGGAEVMLMNILRNKPADVHFDFLVNNPPEDLYREGVFDDEIRSYGCEIMHIGTQLRMGPLKYIRRFKEIYNELCPDVVHIHLNGKCGIISLAAHLAGCKKIITHCHADIRFRGSLLSRILNETELFFQKFLIAHFATGWWGCSIEANKRLYWPWIRKNSVVINNAIDLAAYQAVKPEDITAVRRSYNLPDSTIILGNVGRIVPHKNIAFVIEVMHELRQRGKDVAFVVVGRDDSPEYSFSMRVRANELGIPEERLLFLGEKENIPAVMNSFDVFIGPALKEGFGLVAVEAQAACLPCVLYKGFPESVDMGTGLCFFMNSFDSSQWAEVVLKAIQQKSFVDNNPDTYKMIHCAIQSRGFDARKNAQNVCVLYSTLSSV